MIEQFYRATDNNGSCWDFNCEPKWVEDHWRPANHEYREYTGPNKPSPGKCEKRISVAAVCGLSDFGSLEHKLLEKEHQLTAKEQQIVSLKATLNAVTARNADLESGKRGEVNRLASLKVRLDKAQALVSGLESQVKQLKQHRESDTKDFLDQQTRLHESEKRVAELEKQSKVMPEPVEEVYLRIKNTCLSTSKLGQLATEIGEYYNPFRVERVGIYETKCGLKVYVYLKEGVDWHCHVEGYGHQIVTESGSCMDGKVQLVKRIGDL